ncbi:DUF7010 family protein [Devriesea agamarum]|uniref:DUF7010 family protein n=1 Tax=Devriesea agamarum TaxID=472569 RepID=UPI0038B2ACF4
MGGPAFLPKGHPSIALAMQSAFTVPPGLLIAISLGTFSPSLFLPASLIVVGAHYRTFISLYGMHLYGVLAGALVAIGTAAIFVVPVLRDISGWVGAAVFLVSSVPLYVSYRRETRVSLSGRQPRPAVVHIPHSRGRARHGPR